MPKGTKASVAETALSRAARAKGLTGDRAERYVYGALNNLALMHGNRPTARGRRKARASRPSA